MLLAIFTDKWSGTKPHMCRFAKRQTLTCPEAIWQRPCEVWPGCWDDDSSVFDLDNQSSLHFTEQLRGSCLTILEIETQAVDERSTTSMRTGRFEWTSVLSNCRLQFSRSIRRGYWWELVAMGLECVEIRDCSVALRNWEYLRLLWQDPNQTEQQYSATDNKLISGCAI